MGILFYVVLGLVGGLVSLSVLLQVVARRRAARLTGRSLPSLPGSIGERIGASERALIYFFTPSCAACRPLTPRMKDLEAKGRSVFPVDASQNLDLARALSVMATPTTVEVDHGKIVGVHIGPVAPAVWERFA